MTIRYFDMFAGIGGFRSGLEAVGGFECVGYCEIDKYAKRAYDLLYDTDKELYFDDARTINPEKCPTSISSVADFLAKAFQLQESDEDLTMLEELFSLKLQELPQLKNLSICCLKMFPDCLTMTAAKHLKQSSVRWMTWGTMSCGKCLTAQILAFPNPEIECSLSDIIEKNVPAKYYLSPKQIQKLLSGEQKAVRGIVHIPQTDLAVH